ncbi:alpha/beta hydrolase [Flavobacterium jejuense]|uniref:Alpha/beta hydrolase n=1 Tax=Flavobacterium jejuense TaxID=1544455 RepID=A0ABX0IUR6_9FLAO|nr:alpha/beta hydrolase [Flavobacterium jejuense]NHN25826.1 alpha/beta hydrolase [Flavobacterium jejuense]
MKFFKNIVVIILFQMTFNLIAQSYEVNLWEKEIPNAITNSTYEEIRFFEDSILVKVSQVKIPTLTIFKPKNPNGTAVVICPGGGYLHLAINKEGYKVAEWLNSLGITAVVLKYRLPSYKIMKNKSIGPLQDAQEAMRYVRKNAKKWNLDEHKIGIMGFSAGGHLASTLATKYDKAVYNITDSTSAKPDFSILVYPVISMEETITHKGSKTNLLGLNPSKKLENLFSNETQVNLQTPKTFIIHATDDKSVPVENSINYYLALKSNKVSTEIHVYKKGGHGFGLGKENTSLFWTTDCENWLKDNQL